LKKELLEGSKSRAKGILTPRKGGGQRWVFGENDCEVKTFIVGGGWEGKGKNNDGGSVCSRGRFFDRGDDHLKVDRGVNVLNRGGKGGRFAEKRRRLQKEAIEDQQNRANALGEQDPPPLVKKQKGDPTGKGLHNAINKKKNGGRGKRQWDLGKDSFVSTIGGSLLARKRRCLRGGIQDSKGKKPRLTRKEKAGKAQLFTKQKKKKKKRRQGTPRPRKKKDRKRRGKNAPLKKTRPPRKGGSIHPAKGW